MTKIALCSDSTCDIGSQLQEQYDIKFMPYTIISEGKSYRDNVDIHPNDLFKVFWESGGLPQTSAVNEAEYTEFFNEVLKDYDEIVHLTLGGAITSSAEHAKEAAKAFDNVYVIDSQTLSTGMALLLIRAGEMIKSGSSAAEIAEELENLRFNTHASFVLDTLEFMRAGGRCSSIAAIATSLLNIKPSIIVDNATGALNVGKKYRGNLSHVIKKYVNDQLDHYDDIITDHIFITHTDIPDECIDAAREVLEERLRPKYIHDTSASCTISCHCGPGTLGVLFLTETPSK